MHAAWASFSAERVEDEGSHAILYNLAGNLTGCESAYEFLEGFRADLESSSSPLYVLDMDDVPSINSSGIGIIVSCFNAAKERERRMCLANVSPAVEGVLKVAG